ncbi:spore protein YabP [Clostridiales bacterium]|nr:spore protein YabP [Clostridiales bacterium]
MGNDINNSYRHRILLEEREKLSITGVTDVIAFDEETITADTDMGAITIRGEGLHISKLNLDEGILQTEGSVDSIEYGDGSTANKGGFILGKIFR